MDVRKNGKLLGSFGFPVLTVLAGLILLVNPDGATALVTKLIGWVLVIAGALPLVAAALGNRKISAGTWFWHGLAILAGVLLLAKPMILADSLGRFFGVLLLIGGFRSLRAGGFDPVTALTIVAGVVLVVVPRTLTQTVLGICGIALMVLGVINILGRFNEMKRLEKGSNPNIIDADM